jgi:N-acetyltransferase
MALDLQKTLENDQFVLFALKLDDFEELYAVASDPMIWEQHPNKDRYQEGVFRVFFEGAIRSGSAYKIVDKITNKTIGSTRFYDFDEQKSTILIGYTFYARAYWGTPANREVKKMMLDEAFQYVTKVQFHIGAKNIRSQIAIGRLGAQKIDEREIEYYGEPSMLNFIYEITSTQNVAV